MKVALVIQHGKIGGIEQHVLTLAKGLKQSGVEPIVIMLFSGGPMVELFEQENIEYVILNGRNGHDFRMALQLVKILQIQKPDIVHMHAVTLIGALTMWFFPKLPLIITEHMAKMGRQIPIATKIIYTIVHSKANRIIAVSESTKESLLDFNSSISHKILTVYNGIEISDTNSINGTMFPMAKYVVGAVGRLDAGKGWESFLDVASLIVKELSDCHFVIIGDGPFRPKLEALATELGISSNMHFLGFRNDVRDILKTMDLYVMLSEYEACPLSLLEVMSERVPVAGFLPIGGVSEINADIYPLLDHRDTDDLAEQIFAMLSGDYDLKDMTDRAYERINSTFNAQNMCKKVIKIYQEVLAK